MLQTWTTPQILLFILQIWEAIHPWGRCGWAAVRRWWTGCQAPVSSGISWLLLYHSFVSLHAVFNHRYQLHLLRKSQSVHRYSDKSMWKWLILFLCSVEDLLWWGCDSFLLLCGWCLGFPHPFISKIINEQQRPAWAKPSSKWGSKNTSWSVHPYQPFSFLFL